MNTKQPPGTGAGDTQALGSGPGTYTRDGPEPPARLGNYVLTELIGRGAMGRVYKADQLEPVRRTVAVKMLAGELADPEVLARFAAERQALARMSHPNIAQVYDAGQTPGGQPYFVMEYVPGLTLLEYCDSRRFDLERRLALFKQVCSAIVHAHQKGVIHRDIKPSNIPVAELDGDAVPKIVDFGLAKALAGRLADRSLRTHVGTLLGTPAYMSPEQAGLSDDVVDTRSDIYALGMVLYELCTGTLPFRRAGIGPSTIEQVLRAICEEEPKRPSQLAAGLDAAGYPPGLNQSVVKLLRQDLDWIILKCVAKEPDERYESAGELLADIERFGRGEPVSARRSSIGYTLSKGLRRYRIPLAAGAVVVGLALVLGGGWLKSRADAAAQARAAQRFGQTVEQMAGRMRLAHTIPLHDTSAARQAIQAQIQALRAQLDTLDEWSRNAAHYALGEAYLALDRPREALVRLRLAWQSGYRNAATARALGLAYGRRYQAGLATLEQERNADQRAARLKELRQEFRVPALSFLKIAAAESGEDSLYGRALIAFYEGDWERSRTLARRALEQEPWLYEAARLAGDSWRMQANRLRDAGGHERALAAYAEAEAAYRRAAEIGESDPGVYTRLCALATERMRLHLYGPEGDTLSLFKAGETSCNQALIAYPAGPRAYARQSALLMLHGRALEKSGGDPVSIYKAAAESGMRAAALDPSSELGLLHAGTAYQRLAEFKSSRTGSDPREWLSRAADAYRRALAIAPLNPDIYNELGNVLAIRGEYLTYYTDLDPMPDFLASLPYYARAIELRPDSPYFHNNLGIAYADIAERARITGENPVPWFEKSFAAYQRAIELKPDHTYAYNNLGLIYIARARYAVDVGRDPLPWLVKATEMLQQAVALKPDYGNGWHNLGRAWLNRAEAVADAGRDPSAAADKAIAAFKRTNAIYPNSDAWLNMGNTYLALADWRLQQGKSPESALDAAWSAYSEALEILPNNTHALANRWEVYIKRGYAMLAAGEDPRSVVREAAVELDKLAAASVDNYEPAEKAAEAWTLIARYEINAGLNASRALANAAARYRQALEINDNPAWLHLRAAELHVMAAGYALKAGNPSAAALDAAYRQIQYLHANHPDYDGLETVAARYATLEQK